MIQCQGMRETRLANKVAAMSGHVTTISKDVTVGIMSYLFPSLLPGAIESVWCPLLDIDEEDQLQEEEEELEQMLSSVRNQKAPWPIGKRKKQEEEEEELVEPPVEEDEEEEEDDDDDDEMEDMDDDAQSDMSEEIGW